MKILLTAVLFISLVGCTEKRQNSLLESAEEQLLKNNYPQAIELFKKAAAINPESKPAEKALYKLGYIQENQLKDYESAVFNYQECVRLSKDSVTTYEILKKIANIYFEQGKETEKAITTYKKMLVLNPNSLEGDFIQFRIAQSQFRLNKFEEARQEYQVLIDKYPKSQMLARVRYEIGNSFYMEGRYEIAIEALKQVIRNYSMSTFSVEAEFLIALSLEQLNKLQNALQYYEGIKKRYPSPEIITYRIEELKKRIRKEK